MKYLALMFALLTLARPVAADVLVFAAASLKEPLDQLAASVGNVTVSYGGSGTLARQVSLGAPADVVILANADWMDVLEDAGHVFDPVDILSNRLVIVSATQSTVPLNAAGMEAALADGRIAMGFTSSVPAGIYGKAAFESFDLWDIVRPHIAEVDSARAALALVARKEVPLGVVYATDARVVPTLNIAAVFPETSHPPIRYVAALTRENAEAAAFLRLLQGDTGRTVFENAGFLPVTP